MDPETISPYTKHIRVAFILVAFILPLQLYMVLTQGNVYPCLHLPGFQPVLDNHTSLYYTDRNLYAITQNQQRIPVKYTTLFNVLPEYFARHTMNHLFVANRASHTIVLDKSTKHWIHERLISVTGTKDIDFLEVETISYQYNKENPSNPEVSIQYTLILPLLDE